MKIGLQTWGSEGDVRPFLALATGLARAGHEVTLVVTDDPIRDYRRDAEQGGFRLVSVPFRPAAGIDIDTVGEAIVAAGNPLRQAELIMRFGFDPVQEEMFAAARALCADNDLVVGHFFVFPLRVAAELAGTPVATVNLVHNCVPSRSLCPPGFPNLPRPLYPLGWWLTRQVVNRIFLPRVNALRRRAGLPSESDVMGQTWAAPRLNLIAVGRVFCPPPPDWETRHAVCGFLNPAAGADEPLPAGVVDFLANGPAPVYFTFGSMLPRRPEGVAAVAELWREAAERAGVRAILQLPAGSAAPDSPTVLTVPRTPYRQVFPHCAAVVHHGGAGTTQTTLHCGTPSLVVAHMADQLFWGSELQRLGAAACTLRRRGLTPKRLAKGVRATLERPGLADNARHIGTNLAGEDGVATAVQLIETTFA